LDGAAITKRGESEYVVWIPTQYAIDEWIATARELGRVIPKPRGRLLLA
jgi:hypothetical protein